MSRQGIVRGGAWCADHNKLIDRWPDTRPSSLATILSQENAGGGNGANVAVDLKKLARRSR